MTLDILYNMKREMLRRGLSRQTVKAYLYHVQRFLLFLKHKDPSHFSKADVREYLYYLKEKGLLEEYENAKEDALQIASIKSDELIESYGLEMDKRSRFQYDMTESIQEQKANTSLKRAKQFMLEMKKLLL